MSAWIRSTNGIKNEYTGGKTMSEERNNSYRFKGRVVEMPAPKTGVNVSGEWMVQTVIVEEQEYHKRYSFEIFGKDKCEKFDLHVGDNVNLSFNLVSSQYNGRYYTTCRIWNVYKNGSANNENSNKTQSAVETKKPAEESPITNVDQLPF